jgi:hypothetical protein
LDLTAFSDASFFFTASDDEVVDVEAILDLLDELITFAEAVTFEGLAADDETTPVVVFIIFSLSILLPDTC